MHSKENKEEFLKDILNSLESIRKKIGDDCHDLPMVNEHLSHVSKTTETGVTDVLNTAETIMSDSATAMESLNGIGKKTAEVKNGETLANEIGEVEQILDNVQNNCFSIITSLEFEDINRQLMEKIMFRLDELYGNLTTISSALNLDLEEKEKNDSAFLKDLKRIIDIDDSRRHTQEAIDEAIANPREVNQELVRAQEGRRILDRLFGYSLSP
ncbi:MAG: hypothetical protein GY950_25220, partial [bacterium]|nr:hypothetical protein [bacterium]